VAATTKEIGAVPNGIDPVTSGIAFAARGSDVVTNEIVFATKGIDAPKKSIAAVTEPNAFAAKPTGLSQNEFKLSRLEAKTGFGGLSANERVRQESRK